MSNGNGGGDQAPRKARCGVVVIENATGVVEIHPITDPDQFDHVPTQVEVDGLLARAKRARDAMAVVALQAAHARQNQIVVPRNPRLG